MRCLKHPAGPIIVTGRSDVPAGPGEREARGAIGDARVFHIVGSLLSMSSQELFAGRWTSTGLWFRIGWHRERITSGCRGLPLGGFPVPR